jgi:hypothetical protein
LIRYTDTQHYNGILCMKISFQDAPSVFSNMSWKIPYRMNVILDKWHNSSYNDEVDNLL